MQDFLHLDSEVAHWMLNTLTRASPEATQDPRVKELEIIPGYDADHVCCSYGSSS
jgi:hypothetical protein